MFLEVKIELATSQKVHKAGQAKVIADASK